MVSLFLACCVRGMEVTRHFTPELGAIIVGMVAVALLVAVLMLLMAPVLLRRKTA